MKDVADFLKELIRYYPADKDTGKDAKIVRIKRGLEGGRYNFQAMFDELTKYDLYGKFPSWAAIKEISHKHRAIELLYDNEPGRVDGVHGKWVCENCFGQGGRLVREMRDGAEYQIFYPCPECHGAGQARHKNVWVPFLTIRQLDNDKGMNLMLNIIGKGNNERERREKKQREAEEVEQLYAGHREHRR